MYSWVLEFGSPGLASHCFHSQGVWPYRTYLASLKLSIFSEKWYSMPVSAGLPRSLNEITDGKFLAQRKSAAKSSLLFHLKALPPNPQAFKVHLLKLENVAPLEHPLVHTLTHVTRDKRWSVSQWTLVVSLL